MTDHVKDSALETVHKRLPEVLGEYRTGKLDRREFLRISTLLGLSAVSAYALTGQKASADFDPATGSPLDTQIAQAAGGTLRISMRCPATDNPATFSWVYDSNIVRPVLDYLTRTGVDNITRPWLLEKWQASDDLKTWTLTLKTGIKWSNGDELVADHAIWNLKRWIDPAVGSSVMSFFQGMLLVDYDTGEKDDKGNPKMSVRPYAENAIEKIDEYTFRLNGQTANLAVPEAFFHYPALIMHPSSEGKFGVGAVGTGPFSLEVYDVFKRAVLKRRDGYWGEPVKIDSIEFHDHGDDAAAALAALASKQVDGMYEAQTTQYAALKAMPHVEVYQIATGNTAVARMQPTHDTWKDARVRKAMRLALDTEKLLQQAHLGLGAPGEHHHVCPVHPEYANIGIMKQDIQGAKKLLADAGVPDGFDTEIFCKSDPDWEPAAVQAMAQMWKQIGVNVQINILPSQQYWDIWNAPTAPFAFTTWLHRPLGVMVLGLAYRTGGVWNESFFANPEFDELLTKAEGLLDVEKRRAVMAEIETLMNEEGPAIIPLWRAFFTVMAKNVKGFEVHPSQYLLLEKVSIEA